MKKRKSNFEEAIASLQAQGKKLSKYALWRIKNPNGLEGMVINDMRAVMR